MTRFAEVERGIRMIKKEPLEYKYFGELSAHNTVQIMASAIYNTACV